MKLPQLSLRELFLLIALAAMGCGWWAQNRAANVRFEEQEKKVEDAIAQLRLEEAKSAVYQGRIIVNPATTPALEDSEYRDAYFYLREFAPKSNPDGL